MTQSSGRKLEINTLRNLQSRHEEIAKITGQMEELAELFADLDALIV